MMPWRCLNSCIWGCFALLIIARGDLQAQHPIEVERKTASADYFKALVAFERLPMRVVTPDAVVAAGKSAWALGLAERASKEFDRALRSAELTPVQRARLLLSRGIIEFQESRYQVAALFAERAIEMLDSAGPLRSQVWFLWAESLAYMSRPGVAEEKYLRALEEAGPEAQADIAFRLGECQQKLGKLEQARQTYEQVPIGHERAPDAVRRLAQIALDQRRFPQASFWLDKGRAEFPDHFLDSWVDYALMQSAIDEGDDTKVRELREAALKRYPPSDDWATLLQAAAEAFLWGRGQAVLPGSAKASLRSIP